LGAQLYTTVSGNDASKIIKVGIKPQKFQLKKSSNRIEVPVNPQIDDNDILDVESEPELTGVEKVIKKKKFDFLEKELHAFLTYYAYHYLHCYTKTINHSQSTKKEFGEWVHPDIVGCYYPIDEWKPEVYELSSAIGNVSIKLLSFEVKRELSFGNLRECFFQTVSNSSWANESYLVASKIAKDPNFIDELRRLSTSFGIGVIKLNLDDPQASEIILAAKYRESLDWETINKLTMNTDFKEFLTRVKIDISSKKIHFKEYDQVLDIKDLRILDK